MWYVYILQCNNKCYYTGCTNNIKERLERHKNGLVHYTKDKLPVKLITYIAFTEKHKAFQLSKNTLNPVPVLLSGIKD